MTMIQAEARLIPINLDAFPVGKPIPYSVYDHHDNLLLRKGFILSSEKQRDRLLQRGLIRHSDTMEPDVDNRVEDTSFSQQAQSFTVFEIVETLLSRLEQAYQLVRSPQKEHFPFLMSRLALDIQCICHDNPDAVLGAMQIGHDMPYGLIHPLHCAVLCELVAKRLGITQIQRLSLVAAAASHDIGITELQEQLHLQMKPLTDEQWQQIQKHPHQGHELLQAAGVDDQIWLNMVIQHHERLDGSGYPKGLTHGEILKESRILAIADIYTAMIRPKLYREAFVAQDALRSIFLERGATVDPELIRIFIKEVGIFPPGGFVRLQNGEVAVIRARGKTVNAPVTVSVLDPDGMPMQTPLERNPREPAYAIMEMHPHLEHASLQLQLNELWPPLSHIASW